MTKLVSVGVWAVAILSCDRDTHERLRRDVAPSRAPSVVVATARPACNASMVMVGPARFLMGSPKGVGEADEWPARDVDVGAFCIAVRETTVAEYGRCVAAKRCAPAGRSQAELCTAGRSDGAQHPINCIRWDQAAAYCRWIGARLPTEAEWELAARGTDGRTYSWGNEPPDATRLNVCGTECSRVHAYRGGDRGWPPMHDGDDGYATTAPVGQFVAGASPFGLLDAAGNVWEWTATELAGGRAVRGGGWLHNLPERVRVANRHSYAESESNGHLGVRCAAELER